MPYRPTQGTKRKGRAYTQRAIKKAKLYNPRYQELKFFDGVNLDNAVSSTGFIVQSINKVPQGTTESNRIGRKIWIRRIECNFTASLPKLQDTDDIGDGDILRIIIFVDRQTNGAPATVPEILDESSFNSHYNMNNRERFTFLWDKLVVINRMVSGTDGPNRQSTPKVNKHVSFNRNMYGKGISVDFDASTGAVSEMRTNNIGMLYISLDGNIGITGQQTRIFYDG